MTEEKEDKSYDLEERLIDFAVRIIRIDFNFYDQH
jgi:hypothetical protein